MAHAQRLLPIEQLLSEAGMPSAVRPAGKPAIVPEARKAEGSSAPRSGFISPFAADTARKSKTELSSEDNAAASIRSTPRIAGSMAAPVVMGSAAPATAPQTALHRTAADEAGLNRIPLCAGCGKNSERRSERLLIIEINGRCDGWLDLISKS